MVSIWDTVLSPDTSLPSPSIRDTVLSPDTSLPSPCCPHAFGPSPEDFWVYHRGQVHQLGTTALRFIGFFLRSFLHSGSEWFISQSLQCWMRLFWFPLQVFGCQWLFTTQTCRASAFMERADSTNGSFQTTETEILMNSVLWTQPDVRLQFSSQTKGARSSWTKIKALLE